MLATAAALPACGALPAVMAKRAADFMQFTDQAVLEMQVLHATRALHLLGPYSRFHFNHPGPFFFYVVAPFYALSGHATKSVWLAVWLVNTACLAAIAYVVDRCAGRLQALVTSALMAWQVLCLGAEHLCDPWGPWVVVIPFELLAVLCAATGAGRRGALAPAVLVASFVVQTNVGTLPIALAMLAAGVAVGISRGVAGPDRWREIGRWKRPALAAAVTALVAWALPLFEELRARTGNLTKLRNFFAEDHTRHSLREVFGAVSEHLSTVIGLDSARRLRASASAVHEPASDLVAATVVLLALLPVAFVISRRLRHAYVSSGCVVAAAGTLTMLVSGTNVVGPLMSYLFLWTTGLGTLTVSFVLGEVVALAMHRAKAGKGEWSARTDRWALPVAFIAAALALRQARKEMPPVPWFYGRPAAELRALVDPVERYLRDEHVTEPLVRIGSESAWGTTAGVLLQLYKDGVPFSIEAGWRFMFGSQFAPAATDGVLVFGDPSYESIARSTAFCTLLAESNGTYVFGSRKVSPGSAQAAEIPDDPCP